MSNRVGSRSLRSFVPDGIKTESGGKSHKTAAADLARRIPSLLLLLSFLVSCQAGPDTGKTTLSQHRGFVEWESRSLADGVEWFRFLGNDSRFGSSQSYQAVEIDLEASDAEVEFLWFFERSALLSMVANQVGAIAAINGTYLGVDDQYFRNGGTTRQRIVAPGEDPRSWSYEGALYYDREGRFGIVRGYPDLYERMEQPGLMSAGPLLIDRHRLSGISPPERPSHEHARHPRTAVALSAGGKRLYLVTVDGRAQQAAGLTTPELTVLLREEFLAESALNLDGGGTTTMWVHGGSESGVVNYPSDNGLFDHEGERWTGQAIVLLPSDDHIEPERIPEKLCTAQFGPLPDGDHPERYLYLGDQIDGLTDMPEGMSFTFSLWIRPQAGEGTMSLLNKRIADRSDGSVSRGYELSIKPDGTIQAVLDNGESEVRLQGESAVEADRWSHLVFLLREDRAELYLNGESYASVSDPALRLGFDNPFFLTAGARRDWALPDHRGRTYPHSPWGRPHFTFHRDPYFGEMDELMVWHRALAPDEIRLLGASRMGRSFPEESREGLVSFWGLNDAYGSRAVDRAGRVHGTYLGAIERVCD